MTETTGKAKAAAKKAGEKAKDKVEQVKGKLNIGKMLGELWESIKKGNGKEALQKAGALISAIIAGKLKGLKAEVEEDKKKKKEKKGGEKAASNEEDAEEDNEDEEEPEEDSAAVAAVPAQAPANDNAVPEELPDDLTGIPYNSENILRCKDLAQCQALMKANGFILDEGSGNYVNPKWLTPEKILKEPVVEESIGGKKIKLKRSVMVRLKKADEMMFKETGEHVKVGQHFRSNQTQFDLYKKLKPKGGRVAYPGYSFHEIGQAVDLPLNWEKAQKYMWAAGFLGGKSPIGLSRDANHFSVGEMSMNSKRVAALKAEGIGEEAEPQKKAA